MKAESYTRNELLNSDDSKGKILAEFLSLVAGEYDWSDETLRSAIKNCGIDERLTNLIFPDGCFEISKLYISQKNTEALEKALEYGYDSTKISKKISAILLGRFMVEDVIQFTKLRKFLQKNRKFIASCYNISDFMWQSVNDTSTDFNYYTKRASLCMILLRVSGAFIKNQNEDLIRSEIDKHIQTSLNIAKIKSKLGQASSFISSNINNAIFDESGLRKPIKEIISDLPFIRLRKN